MFRELAEEARQRGLRIPVSARTFRRRVMEQLGGDWTANRRERARLLAEFHNLGRRRLAVLEQLKALAARRRQSTQDASPAKPAPGHGPRRRNAGKAGLKPA